MADIVGIEGLSVDDVRTRVSQGGRFVIYTWALSLVVVTLRRPSAIHFVHPGESAVLKGLPYTILSFFVGWWGFPWGFIYTPMAIATNLGGGRDVTSEVMASLGASMPAAPTPGTAFAPPAPSPGAAAVGTDAKAALFLAIPGLFCFPVGWAGIFFGVRAMNRAKAEGLPTPGLAYAGIGIGALGSLCMIGTMIIGALAPKPPPAPPAPAVVEEDAPRPSKDMVVQPGASADSGPYLELKIVKVYLQTGPAAKPPFHAGRGEWTFFDAENADGLQLTVGVHTPKPTGDFPMSFGDVQFSVADADHGQAFVDAFDAQFGGSPGDAKPTGKVQPLKMSAAILGQHMVRERGGGFKNGRNGSWFAAKLFPQLPGHEAEVFFNWSLDEKKVEFTEKDADYKDDLAYVFTTTLGKKLNR